MTIRSFFSNINDFIHLYKLPHQFRLDPGVNHYMLTSIPGTAEEQLALGVSSNFSTIIVFLILYSLCAYLKIILCVVIQNQIEAMFTQFLIASFDDRYNIFIFSASHSTRPHSMGGTSLKSSKNSFLNRWIHA